MFKKPTVLLLGAGASAPFGFPIGHELLENIRTGAQKLHQIFKERTPPYGGGDVRDRLNFFNNPYGALHSYALGYGRSDQYNQASLAEFANRLRNSSHLTIDEFARTNPGQRDLAKLFVALELGRATYEHTSLQRGTLTLNQRILASPMSNWYARLVSEIRDDCHSAADLEENRLTIITFNYDESLDLYLQKELGNAHIFEGAKADKIAPVSHVFGKLEFSAIPTSNVDELSYGQAIVKVANKFTMLTENRDQHAEHLDAARIAIGEAKRIFVLGFDMHAENIRAIGLDEPRAAAHTFLLNWNGNQRLQSRALECGVPNENILSGSRAHPLEIAQALDDGLFHR